MGDNYNEGNPRERPVHAVYLDSYYIGEFEVTNSDYKKFMDEGGYAKLEYWPSGGFGDYNSPMHWYDAAFNGGGFLYKTFKHRCAYRGSYYPSARKEYKGIRCVREVTVSSIGDDGRHFPESCVLYQNHPNPFNHTTTIQYVIIEASRVSLKIYSIHGYEVAILMNDEMKNPGNYNMKWDGRNNQGVVVASGIYFYKLKAAYYGESKKMILLQ